MPRPSVPHDRLLAVRRAARPTPHQLLRAAALVAVLLSLAVCAGTGWGSVPLLAVPLLAAGVAAAELAVLPLRLGLWRWPVSLTEGAVAACLLADAGAWSVVAVGLGVTVAQTARRCPRRSRELDLAVRVLATALAQAVCAALGGGVAAAAGGMVAFWLVTCVSLAGAVAATSSRAFRSLLATIARLSAVHTTGSAAVGLLAVWLALEAPLGLVGVVVCGTTLWAAYDIAGRRRDEARLLGELAGDAVREMDDAVAQLVTATARVLGGADVDLVVLTRGAAESVTGDERGAVREPSPAPLVRSPWLLSALAADGIGHGRDDQDRPCLTGVLRRPGLPLAVLRARRPHGSADFGVRDRRLVELALVQAAGRLAPAAAPAAPAASRAQDLRAAVDRLDRLTEHGAALHELAEELHELDRAVASLVGSLPRRRSPAPPVPDEWTTTGVLR